MIARSACPVVGSAVRLPITGPLVARGRWPLTQPDCGGFASGRDVSRYSKLLRGTDRMTMRVSAGFALLILIIGNACVAQDAPPGDREPATALEDSATTDFRNMLAELEALRRDDPARYRDQRAVFIYISQMALAGLGFGPTLLTGDDDDATKEAVRSFEIARGMTVTGNVLAPATWTRVVDDADRLLKAKLRPDLPTPGFGSDRWSQGYVVVRGPWISDETSSVDQAVSIECRRERLECRIVYAELGRGGVAGRILRPDIEYYRIARWDNSEIVSEPLDYPCARYLLRLNRVQESVTLTRSTLSTSGTCFYMTGQDLTSRLGTSDDERAALRHSATLSDSLLNLSPQLREIMRRWRRER